MSEVVEVDQSGWFGGWFRWCPTSMLALQNAERRLLSHLRTAYTGKYVDVGNRVDNKDNRVWTVILNEKSPKTPLVLVHGYGAGVGFWVLNLDSLAKDRPVYAFDLLGFGRSSRPKFSTDATRVEDQLIDSIESWREQMRLDKVIILGHSMGGFLATAYAMRYPERVNQLILADPWGFSDKQTDPARERKLPLWMNALITVLQPFNPFSALRVAGPWGPKLIQKFRPDLNRKFATLSEDGTDVVSDYVYHCNAQTPSGEIACRTMTESIRWAKRPMINRISNLSPDIPISFIFGSRSWIDRSPGYKIKQDRADSIVTIHTVHGAGHHVYADRSEVFNKIVRNVCTNVAEIQPSPLDTSFDSLLSDDSSDFSVPNGIRASTPN